MRCPSCEPDYCACADFYAGRLAYWKGEMMPEAMSVDELVDLITHPSGQIYPFSYAANMMAANGVNPKLVQYFHDAAANQNRDSYDRSQILSDYKNGVPYELALADSILRINPHLLERPKP